MNLLATGKAESHLVSKTIIIADNTQPKAHFSYSYADGKSAAPATVIFRNESVNADSYIWQINGMQYALKEPGNIKFNLAGDFLVTLSTYRNNITSEVYQEMIKIRADDSPVAKFLLSYHPFPYAVNEEIQLLNKSENSDAWEWTFGQGVNPSADQHPVLRFAQAGTYPITLIAKKGTQRSQTFSINLKIGN